MSGTGEVRGSTRVWWANATAASADHLPKFQVGDRVVHKQLGQQGTIKQTDLGSVADEVPQGWDLLKDFGDIMVQWDSQNEPALEFGHDINHLPRRTGARPPFPGRITIPDIPSLSSAQCARKSSERRRHEQETESNEAVKASRLPTRRKTQTPRSSKPLEQCPKCGHRQSRKWTGMDLRGRMKCDACQKRSSHWSKLKPLVRQESEDQKTPERLNARGDMTEALQSRSRDKRFDRIDSTDLMQGRLFRELPEFGLQRTIYKRGDRVQDVYTDREGTVTCRDVTESDDMVHILWDGPTSTIHKVSVYQLEKVQSRSNNPVEIDLTEAPSKRKRKDATYLRTQSLRRQNCQQKEELFGDLKEEDEEDMEFLPRAPVQEDSVLSSLSAAGFRLPRLPRLSSSEMTDEEDQMKFQMPKPPRRSSSESSRQESASLLEHLMQKGDRDDGFSSDASASMEAGPRAEHSRTLSSYSTSSATTSSAFSSCSSDEDCRKKFSPRLSTPGPQFSYANWSDENVLPMPRKKSSAGARPQRLQTLSPVDESLGPIASRTPSPNSQDHLELLPPMSSRSSSETSDTPRRSLNEGDKVTHLETGYTGSVTGVFNHRSLSHNCWVKWDYSDVEKQVAVREIRLTKDLEPSTPVAPPCGINARQHSSGSISLTGSTGRSERSRSHSPSTKSGGREPLKIGDPVEVKKDNKWHSARYRGEDTRGHPMYAAIEYNHSPGEIRNVKRNRISNPRARNSRNLKRTSSAQGPCLGNNI